jgi:hypothetical protein
MGRGTVVDPSGRWCGTLLWGGAQWGILAADGVRYSYGVGCIKTFSLRWRFEYYPRFDISVLLRTMDNFANAFYCGISGVKTMYWRIT